MEAAQIIPIMASTVRADIRGRRGWIMAIYLEEKGQNYIKLFNSFISLFVILF